MSNINHIENRSKITLHSACKNQDLELVKSLLKNGENPNAVDNKMFTPLHLACGSKSDVTVKIIEVLLQHNANIEAASFRSEFTPLHIAYICNNDVAVKCLLENHANPNATDFLGFTLIFYTVEFNRSLSMAQLLLQYNANIEATNQDGRTPFLQACYKCDYEVAKFLLDNHGNPFAVDNEGCTSLHLACQTKNNMTVPLFELLLQYHVNIEAASRDGRTPFLQACYKCDYEVAKFLLDNHANPFAVDNEGCTSLHLACRTKNNMTVPLIELLLQHHANIEAVDKKGRTPLMTACVCDNFNAMKCLLDHHANIEAVDKQNMTPLKIACNNNHYDLIKYLLDHHANIEAANAEGWTPLLGACTTNNFDAIKCLLEHHANIEATNAEGWTPLMIACKNGYYNPTKFPAEQHAFIEVVNHYRWTRQGLVYIKNNYNLIKYLLDHHANIEAANAEGWTPLMIACANDNLDAMKCLLDHHANIKAVDAKGQTPLLIACKGGNYNIIKCLLDHHANIEAVDSTVSTSSMASCSSDNHNAIKPLLNFNLGEELLKIMQNSTHNHSKKTLLHSACKNQDLELVKSSLKNGENPNAVDNEKLTPLHLACKSISDVTVKIIELLLQHNANIEAAENECGWTPLFTACIHNNDVVVKYLLEKHANPNAMDKLGCTALHWVFLCNSDAIALSVAQLLLQYNANIEARSYDGRTSFLVACWNCNYVAAKFLLDNHANIFAVDNKGSTSLHLACQTKDNMTVPLIELLLQHHANIEAVDKKSWTPLMVASNRGNCDAIKCLFNHYANVNHSDINNSTALHMAIERQSMETTKCLIKCNADINLLDKENQTPLEKASKMESSDSYPSEIVQILIFEVAKLKVAGFKIHDHNLDILHNYNVRWPLLIDESRYTDEIEQMKMTNIGNNDITLYDFLKNDISFLFQFVTNEEIQQQLKQEDLDKQFPSYINIVRNRFREVTIQCTRNELINQAK